MPIEGYDTALVAFPTGWYTVLPLVGERILRGSLHLRAVTRPRTFWFAETCAIVAPGERSITCKANVDTSVPHNRTPP